jgi:mRNA interferase MazF
MSIHRGGVYWIRRDETDEAEILHPQVVVSDVAIDDGGTESVMVCGISTNMKKAYEFGNILLDDGEAGLPKKSVVVVSQLSTVPMRNVGGYIGTLGEERMREIARGMDQVENLRRR